MMTFTELRTPILGALASILLACTPRPAPAPLTAEVKQVLDTIIQDEYYAENLYLRVLAEHGKLDAFVDPLYGELQHATRIAHLYLSRQLDAPISRWNVLNVPSYESAEEACRAAIGLEQETMAKYDRFLRKELPPDVRDAITELRGEGETKHLPGFRACAEGAP